MEKVKKKIFVLGSTGMLGHQVFDIFNKSLEYDVIDVVYRNKLRAESIICDITNKEKISHLIIENKPDFIINCIGVLINGSKNNAANAIYINSFFPFLLKQVAEKIGAKVIHISTDCVFSGKTGSYKESDYRDADDIYGRSKALGELNYTNHLTLRTSIIGPELKEKGEGLLHWYLNQKGEVSGYVNAIWGGVTTLECAKAIEFAVKFNTSGIVNLTNGTSISKYDLLQLIKEQMPGDETRINSNYSKKIDKSLISERFDFQYKVPSYPIMIKDLINNLVQNKNKYPHYFIAH
jgi:dTDP-4-dehydrorhamnose reductase